MKKILFCAIICVFFRGISFAQDKVGFTFYGTNVSVRVYKKQIPFLESCDPNSVADAVQKYVEDKYFDPTVTDCEKIKEQLRLNDWGYIKLLEKVAKTAVGTNNGATLFTFYLCYRAGYKTKLARSNKDNLYILFASKNYIYNTLFFYYG